MTQNKEAYSYMYHYGQATYLVWSWSHISSYAVEADFLFLVPW